MKILICKRENVLLHSTNWTQQWITAAEIMGLDYHTVDLLFVDNAIEIVREYDILLWHFDNYCYEEMLQARSILYSALQMGLKVFPGFSEAWHFDDKIAEMYALQACQAPIPRSWVFYSLDQVTQAMKNGVITFPKVAKLRTGAGSHNVKLIQSEAELRTYARRMFAKGFDPAPSLLYKTSSNIRSSHNWKTFVAKLKRVPEFLRNLKRAKQFPRERGYVYLQEFIPNDGFDIKVVVIGDKLTGLHRPIRSYDFRASGGGEVLYDKSLFSQELINTAFSTADKLQMKCVGFDFIIDNRTNKPIIVEMSYGFSSSAVEGMGGYFDRDGTWYNKPVNAPMEILSNLLNNL